MDEKQTRCDSDRLERFLCDQLGEREQAELERHLGACDRCRQELERQAAEPPVWGQLRQSLEPDELDSKAGEPQEPVGSASAPAGSAAASARSGELEPVRAGAVLDALAPTEDPRMLGRLGGYEIAGVIGCGGMGVVLKGFDAALNRYVAIKVLAPHLAASGSARRRFAREAQAAAAVVHENVVAIHSVAEAAGLPYLVMEYIRGTSLQRRLDQHGPLELARGASARTDRRIVTDHAAAGEL